MPDGFGDGVDMAALRAWSNPYQQNRSGLVAVARLCRVMGLGKRDTAKVLGLKANADNYRWIDHVCS